jgi:penicillin V acylase-like amidase (Ntn superfamily)
MNRWVRCLSLAALLVSTACASGGVSRRPAGTVAEYGVTIADTLGKIGTAATDLQKAAPDRFPAARALQLQEYLKQANEAGRALAPVLRLIDAATTPVPADVDRAKVLVDQISTAVVAASALVFTGDQTNAITSLIQQLLKTTNTVLVELGKHAISRADPPARLHVVFA